jgi:hypothetical protein
VSFLDGYHAGLFFTVALVLVGVVVSYVALRTVPATIAQPATATEQVEEAAAAGLAG